METNGRASLDGGNAGGRGGILQVELVAAELRIGHAGNLEQKMRGRMLT